jgi:molecular chaperone GrpE (heat shock protein)
VNEKWNPEDIATLIRGRKILKAKGLSKDADVKKICEEAGISRKTGYQWANKLEQKKESEVDDLEERFKRLQAEHEELKKRYDDVRFENEGRKLAWKIHGVGELLAGKKNTTKARKKRKR